MRNAKHLVKIIKKTSVDANETTTPIKVYYGTVINEAPLQIQIDPKQVLQPAHLILTRNVTEHQVEMSVGGGAKQMYTVHAALKKGEKVMMLRTQGGLPYVVLDRV